MMFYICASVKGVILSLSACKRLGIVDNGFPQIAKMKEDGTKAVEEDVAHCCAIFLFNLGGEI